MLLSLSAEIGKQKGLWSYIKILTDFCSQYYGFNNFKEDGDFEVLSIK